MFMESPSQQFNVDSKLILTGQIIVWVISKITERCNLFNSKRKKFSKFKLAKKIEFFLPLRRKQMTNVFTTLYSEKEEEEKKTHKVEA